jgi:phosphatidylserine/phosphatidylglycerophosphate/cardiolipin synthase-like enzyme
MVLDDDDCVTRMPDEMRRLRKAGAVLRHLATNCDMFQLQHDKFGIFDDERVISGPANWTKAGIISNYENFIVYDNAEYVGAFDTLFERAFALAQPRSECGCDPREPECRKRFCLDRPMPR